MLKLQPLHWTHTASGFLVSSRTTGSLTRPRLEASNLLHRVVSWRLIETSNHHRMTWSVPSTAGIPLWGRRDSPLGLLLLLPLLVLLRWVWMTLLMMNRVSVSELGKGNVVDEEADDNDYEAEELKNGQLNYP